MRPGVLRLVIVLALLLAWEIIWFFVLGSDSLCHSGRCTIHRDLALLYYLVSIGSLVAFYVWRDELHIPKRFEIPIYILLFLRAIWAVDSFQQETNNQIPAIEISIDTVVMSAALALCLVAIPIWKFGSRNSEGGSEESGSGQ